MFKDDEGSTNTYSMLNVSPFRLSSTRSAPSGNMYCLRPLAPPNEFSLVKSPGMGLKTTCDEEEEGGEVRGTVRVRSMALVLMKNRAEDSTDVPTRTSLRPTDLQMHPPSYLPI